jgi:Raf kinase inhibitor-like YbhB/YbcL family protein
MRFVRWFAIPLMISVLAVSAMTQAPAGRGPAGPPLTMTIGAFADGTDIPAKYTQAGDSTSPSISWTNIPTGTQSFVLHMHDMEGARMRTTEDMLHWMVWNIPATVTSLPEGAPMGEKLQNGAYQLSARGPVYLGPGAGAAGPRHHYTFELFALDTTVDVQPGTDPFETRANILKAIQGHILGKAVYVGLFHRPQ